MVNYYYDMFVLQNRLNELINRNWKKERTVEDWKIAIFVEMGELIDSLDWKWWKKQKDNLDNVKTEIIDIIHFVISAQLNLHGIPKEEMIDDVYNFVTRTFNLIESPKIKRIKTNKERIFLAIEKTLNYINYYGKYEQEEPNLKETLEYIYYLIKLFNLTEEEVYIIYVSKNVLNIFRQKYGYKEGTYQKIWNGLEDNEIVHQLLKKYKGDYKNLPKKLMKDLEHTYNELVKKS